MGAVGAVAGRVFEAACGCHEASVQLDSGVLMLGREEHLRFEQIPEKGATA
jgi:hypothetical protein